MQYVTQPRCPWPRPLRLATGMATCHEMGRSQALTSDNRKVALQGEPH